MAKIENPIRSLFIFILFFAQVKAWSIPNGILESFHTLSSAGSMLSAPVNAEVEGDEFFKMPDEDMVNIIWPASVAGRVQIFSKGTAVIYEPQKKLAISVQGLPQPTREELIAKYKADINTQLGYFKQKIAGAKLIAGTAGFLVDYVKKPAADSWIEKTDLVIDARYKQILSSDTTYRGGAHSKIVTNKFSVNIASDLPKFIFTPPSGTTEFQINFANHPLTEDAAKAKPGFANFFPPPVPTTFKAISYEEVLGAQGSYSALYRRGADYLAVLAIYKCDFPLDLGVKVSAKNGRDGVLLRGEVNSIYVYKNGDYLMMVFGNTLLEDVMNTAANMK